MTLIHFKCETCVSIDPKGIAENLFGENQHLVVLHKGKNENPHWHFQGQLAVSKAEYEKVVKKMADGHSKKIAKPKSRPVKRALGNITDTGYQYMMKEDPPVVVCSRGFTEEELEELHEKSSEHVDELKAELRTVFQDKMDFTYVVPSKELHLQARIHGFDYYADKEKLPPPNFQRLVLFQLYRAALAAEYPGLARLKKYVAQSI